MIRISTGIPGLDPVLEGGFPHPGAILIKGPPGSGKTILGLQFLYKGAQAGENGLMVGIETFDTEIVWYAESLGMNFRRLQDEGRLVITSYDPAEFSRFGIKTLHTDVIRNIERLIESVGIRRIVIDSVTPLAMALDPSTYRTVLYYLIKALKEKNCSLLIISEDEDNKFSFEQHLCDGVIELSHIKRGETYTNVLTIKKMVATSIPKTTFNIEIGKGGLRVIPLFT